MQPNSNVRSLDDSLYEGQKVLCEIEEIVEAIFASLTGDPQAESAGGGYGLGGALTVADQNTQRMACVLGRFGHDSQSDHGAEG